MTIQIRPASIEDFFDLSSILESLELQDSDFHPFTDQHHFDRYLKNLRKKHYHNDDTITGPFTILRNDEPIGLMGIECEITAIYEGKLWILTSNRYYDHKILQLCITDSLLMSKEFSQIRHIGCFCPIFEKELKKALIKMNFAPSGSPQYIDNQKNGLQLYIKELV